MELVRIRVEYNKDVPIKPEDPRELVIRKEGQFFKLVAVDVWGTEEVLWRSKNEDSVGKKLVKEILKRGNIVEIGKG